MCESLNIINQVVFKLSKFNKITNNQNKNYTTIQPHSISRYLSTNNWNKVNNKNSYNSMETLIEHFKFWGEGSKVKSNFTIDI